MSGLEALRAKKKLALSSGEMKDDVPPLHRSNTPKSIKSKQQSERLAALMQKKAQTGNANTGGTPINSGKSQTGRGARVLKTIKPAEVHFIGELTGCSGFGDGVSCRWTLDYGDSWKLTSEIANDTDTKDIEDEEDDNDNDATNSTKRNRLTEQTHYAYGSHYGEPIWSHPLDFQCRSDHMEGWPRLLLEVFKLDEFGRNDLVGYGVVDLPRTNGAHELECTTWRPRGDRKAEYSGKFGNSPFFEILLINLSL